MTTQHSILEYSVRKIFQNCFVLLWKSNTRKKTRVSHHPLFLLTNITSKNYELANWWLFSNNIEHGIINCLAWESSVCILSLCNGMPSNLNQGPHLILVCMLIWRLIHKEYSVPKFFPAKPLRWMLYVILNIAVFQR